jgi:hypothetical protein
MFLIKHGNHAERPTPFILFPPFWTKLPGEKLGAGDTTQWAQCQCHPQDEFTLRNSHGHPMEDQFPATLLPRLAVQVGFSGV